MKYRILLFSVVLLACSSVTAQAQTIDQDARTPMKSPIEGGNSKQQRKADKKKQKQKDLLDKAIKKGKKKHLSYQEKATRRRMKRSLKKANKWNKQ